MAMSQNDISPEDISPQDVLVINFKQDESAYQALSTLKQLDSQGQLELIEAVVVTRTSDGHIDVKDQVTNDKYEGTTTGGVVGLLVGILGGPFGVLIGGATGLLLGSLWDLDDVDDSESVLSEISKSVQVGRTEVLAEVVEQSPEVVDSAMAQVGGTVVRRHAYDVTAEIAAAQEAQREAKKKAREELHKARHDKAKHDADEKVEQLKAKLHHDKARTATGS
jgi:uncharacterized membrane protein